MAEQRLQKILSQAGVASRRKAEELIAEGRVTVNGEVVTELGSKADFEVDHVKVDGRLLKAPKRHIYLAMNKPKGCVTTVSDPEGRETVMHLLRGLRERVFPVGRLDYQSEGLLLFTNDGDFAHKLTAPASHVTKTYVVKVNGIMTDEQERAFREGVLVHGRRTSPAEIKVIKTGVNPWYEVKITEGRQNQIRLMFAYFGKLVEKLRRVKISFLELDVPPGKYRSLSHQEVEHFQKVLSAPAPPKVVAKVAPKPEIAVVPPAQTKPEQVKLPPKPASKFPPKRDAKFPPRTGSKFPPKSGAKFPPRPASKFPPKSGAEFPAKTGTKFPPRPTSKFPPKTGSKFPPKAGASKFPPKSSSRFPPKTDSKFPPKRKFNAPNRFPPKKRTDGKHS
jgi:23S rRNA pseudouridine2605 synthase